MQNNRQKDKQIDSMTDGEWTPRETNNKIYRRYKQSDLLTKQIACNRAIKELSSLHNTKTMLVSLLWQKQEKWDLPFGTGDRFTTLAKNTVYQVMLDGNLATGYKVNENWWYWSSDILTTAYHVMSCWTPVYRIQSQWKLKILELWLMCTNSSYNMKIHCLI